MSEGPRLATKLEMHVDNIVRERENLRNMAKNLRYDKLGGMASIDTVRGVVNNIRYHADQIRRLDIVDEVSRKKVNEKVQRIMDEFVAVLEKEIVEK